MLRLGSTGAAVAEVRARLAHLGLLHNSQFESLNVYDSDVDRAVRIFQQERGITVDGIVGAETFRRLDEARWQLGDRVLSFTAGHMMIGDDVTELQRKLNELGFNAGRPDGIFGPATDNALREFQRGVGLSADGICGLETLRSFDRLSRSVVGGDSGALREHAQLSSLQTGIADKVVVVDPGDYLFPELTFAIASRLEGRLAALGTQVILTRPEVPTSASTPAQRAGFANEMAADLLISLHVDQSDSPKPNGIAVFYFGHPSGGNHSPAGKQLAELISDELIGRTDRKDCRTHPRTWDLLRLTTMPAVRIDLGYMSNVDDSKRLNSEDFHDAIAHGIAVAITAFCSPR
ncbi:MAG: N-acetylmuramoyl-L-alanine amidase [Candidatus Nanopelagicales bacterium]|nr:N-acetylmuramoyl-L-alanine amidase [Candidatus Nanopelagicales bacterium]MCF8540032.1 N-acetylmuramoyl-L-alanine amidase [Candidatus Nanopelagicales bacterium]MCF8551704.1 N-acetylmuramoyl-L-alanine amidase [Candidatus Nanopelagicales bacterium]